jgi:hypothetical protein
MIPQTEMVFGCSMLALVLVCSGIFCYICQPLKRVRFQSSVERIEYSPMLLEESFMEKIDTTVHV